MDLTVIKRILHYMEEDETYQKNIFDIYSEKKGIRSFYTSNKNEGNSIYYHYFPTLNGGDKRYDYYTLCGLCNVYYIGPNIPWSENPNRCKKCHKDYCDNCRKIILTNKCFMNCITSPVCNRCLTDVNGFHVCKDCSKPLSHIINKSNSTQ